MPLADIAPVDPDAPGVPFPPVAEDAFDPELAALAARLRPGHWWIHVLRALCLIVALGLAFTLRHDVRFAFAASSAVELGEVTGADLAAHAHQLVSVSGVPSGIGAVEYRRPLGPGWYRLAPMVGRQELYVELHLPDGVDPTRWVPPASWVGRLVPLDEAGIRFRHVRALVEQVTGRAMASQVYLLEPDRRPSLLAPSVWLTAAALVVAAVQSTLLGREAWSWARSRRPASSGRPSA